MRPTPPTEPGLTAPHSVLREFLKSWSQAAKPGRAPLRF